MSRTVVVGAGLSGLVAASNLRAAGHDVLVLESQPRVGGRVSTLRDGFAPGLHAEAGALFVLNGHALTVDLAREHGVALEPVPLPDGELMYVRGQLHAGPGADVRASLGLGGSDAALEYKPLAVRYTGGALDRAAAMTMDSLADLGDLDAVSGARLLRDHGASDAVVDYLGLGFLDVSGEGLEACSALLMLRDLALRLTSTGVLRVRGGNDGLPRAVAARLGAAVRTNARVLRVSADAAGARVEVSRDGGREVLECDYVVLAVPLRALARIEFAPALSPAKARAVANVPYASVTRTYLQVSSRAWEELGRPPAATTDLPSRWVFPVSRDPAGRTALLESYTTGAAARALAVATDSERGARVAADLEKLYPGIAAHVRATASKCWDADPHAGGAYAWFRPGEMTTLVPELARPEGRLHFAGEHVSTAPQWMQGAIESGARAAAEILRAPVTRG